MPPFEYLTPEDVLRFHEEVLRSTGGDDGLLLPGNLVLAVEAPMQFVYGFEPYKTLEEKGAALLHDINKLHPFVDGNKRTAYVAADSFLRLNGRKLTADSHDIVDVSLRT